MDSPYISIVCEGTTENLYFNILKTRLRISKVQIEIIDMRGCQHESLVDACVDKRTLLCSDLDLDEENVETWAVCDADGYKSFPKLKKYGDKKKVNIAFSNPQFETFLIQHLELRRTVNKRKKLEAEISGLIGEKYQKTNLSWLDNLVDVQPSILNKAVNNSEAFNKTHKIPFFTVQKLVKKLIDLAD